MRFLPLFLALSLLTTSGGEKKNVGIETPHGKIEWKEGEAKSIARVVREISPEEMKSLRSDAEASAGFIDRYGPHDGTERHPLEVMDLAFAVWLASEDPRKEAPARVIRVLGSAYGFYCIKHLGLRWAWTQDDQGLAIALVRENPTTVSFPFTSIQYRIEDKTTDFIYGLYASLKHLIDGASEKKEEPIPRSATTSGLAPGRGSSER